MISCSLTCKRRHHLPRQLLDTLEPRYEREDSSQMEARRFRLHKRIWPCLQCSRCKQSMIACWAMLTGSPARSLMEWMF